MDVGYKYVFVATLNKITHCVQVTTNTINSHINWHIYEPSRDLNDMWSYRQGLRVKTLCAQKFRDMIFCFLLSCMFQTFSKCCSQKIDLPIIPRKYFTCLHSNFSNPQELFECYTPRKWSGAVTIFARSKAPRRGVHELIASLKSWHRYSNLPNLVRFLKVQPHVSLLSDQTMEECTYIWQIYCCVTCHHSYISCGRPFEQHACNSMSLLRSRIMYISPCNT